MAQVVWAQSAIADVESIYLYIRIDAPGAALHLLEAITESTVILESFPRLGRMAAGQDNPDIRELIVRNYRLIYRLTGEIAEILMVHHGARRPPSFDWT